MNNPSKIYASSHVHHKAYQKPQNSQPDLNQNLDSEILSHSRVGPVSVQPAPKIHCLNFQLERMIKLSCDEFHPHYFVHSLSVLYCCSYQKEGGRGGS